MATYVKLIDGQLQYPQNNTLYIGGCDCMQETFTDAQYLQAGFKLLVKALIIPPLKWFQKAILTYSETEIEIIEAFAVVAADGLANNYIQIIATERDRALENDFLWAGNVVKLDESNQKDYTALYALLSNNQAMIPFVDANFKDHASYFFADYEELNNFAIAILTFVNSVLGAYRDEAYLIQSMTNDQLYEHIQAL